MKVYCANNNTLYDTPGACAKALDVDPAVVSRALQGKRPRAGVYLITYVDSEQCKQEALDKLRAWMLYSVYKIV